ncbi:SAF domain-containing protein [Nocardioides terrisoli]|uniref:SAF domain-containing protein n=1 Tax=Nocardioides terrisoli TaxID=3388267 RepID=UPI00287BA109|nr:SAF domain-containing protein [Nocardioides marmorisolisilvae]
MNSLSRATRRIDRLRNRVLWHRRPLAAVAAAAAVYVGLHAATAPPPRTVPVWTAAHDLPSGAVLERTDLVRRQFTPQSVPAQRLRDPQVAIGHTVASPIGAGQAVSATQLVGMGWLDDRPGMSAVPVRVTDPGVVRLLHVGDRVTLLAADPQHPASAPVHIAADVLAIPSTSDGSSALPGRLVLVGVDRGSAETVARASVSQFLTVLWNK